MALEEQLLVEQSKNKQLELQLEQLKNPTESNDDREPESITRKSVSTRPEGDSALAKDRINRLIKGPLTMQRFKCYKRPLNHIWSI